METTQNKMGIVPVKSLMLTMGLPMILSMTVQALYNIVDSFFVSLMPEGEAALNALTLAFPVQMLMIAVGVGTGVGINSILSRTLGEGNRARAGRIAGNAIFIGLCTYLAFLAFGVFGVAWYLGTQTTDPLALAMGSQYLRICATVSFGAILFMIYEKLLQSTGRTDLSTIAQLAGALTNIALDPVMIFGLLGCPALGITGAAWATVAGQIVSLALGMYFHHARNRDMDTSLSCLKPDKALILEIYGIGVPAIIMQALMSFMNYGINIIIGRIAAACVTAYGVYYRIQQFVFMAAFGMNNALIPVVAFNFGLKNRKRTRDGIKYGMIYTLVIMGAGAILLQLFAKRIAGVFSLSENTEELCVTAIRIITLGYLFAGANITWQGVFQAFGRGVASLVVSLLRLIVITLPAAYLFTRLAHPETLVWWAFPIAELCALGITLAVLKPTRGAINER